MKQYSVPRWLKGFVISSCLSLLCAPMAIAQSGELTRAEVYRLQNIVELLLRNQSPRQARVQDTLAPRDAVQPGSRSLAELIFNEGDYISGIWTGGNCAAIAAGCGDGYEPSWWRIGPWLWGRDGWQ